MNDAASRWCVLLPCSTTQSWAVPQNCLGEILTVAAPEDQPPREVSWRGENVPVMDFGSADDVSNWRDPRSGTGLVAVVLGYGKERCGHWGVAVRGEGLGVRAIACDEMEDLPEAALEHASAAFRMAGIVYQVPDLSALQQVVSLANSPVQA